MWIARPTRNEISSKIGCLKWSCPQEFRFTRHRTLNVDLSLSEKGRGVPLGFSCSNHLSDKKCPSVGVTMKNLSNKILDKVLGSVCMQFYVSRHNKRSSAEYCILCRVYCLLLNLLPSLFRQDTKYSSSMRFSYACMQSREHR